MADAEEGRRLHNEAVELLAKADEGEEANDAAIGTWDYWKSWAINNALGLIEDIEQLKAEIKALKEQQK